MSSQGYKADEKDETRRDEKEKDKFIKYISYIYNFSTKIPVIHHKFSQEIMHTYVVRDSNKQPLVYFVWLAVYIYILSALYLIMKHGIIKD